MRLIVVRPRDTVEVLIANIKGTSKYRFVNLTKGHICTCVFDSVDAAIRDLQQYVADGRVISFSILEK